MIQINTLTPSDVGRWVEYRGRAGELDRGRIKSWNDKYIFVVYACAGEWQRFFDFTAAATNPSDLSFISRL